MPVPMFVIMNSSGGVADALSPFLVRPNELMVGTNIDLTRKIGACSKRRGYKQYARLLGEYRATGLHKYYKADGSNYFLAAFNTSGISVAGIALYCTFEDADSITSSYYGPAGVVGGSPTYATAKFTNGMVIDASGEFARWKAITQGAPVAGAPTDSLVINYNEGCVEFWVKMGWGSAEATQHVFFDTTAGTSGERIVFAYNGSGSIYATVYTPAGTTITATYSISGLGWAVNDVIHLAVSWSNARKMSGGISLQIFAQGTQAAQATTGWAEGEVGTYFYVGCNNSESFNMGCTVDELKVYGTFKTSFANKNTEASDMWISRAPQRCATWQQLGANWGTTGRVYFIDAFDRCYMVDGVNANKRFDGTNFQNWGITAPTAIPAALASGSGSLACVTGWRYKFTYKNTTTSHESNPFTASTSTGAFTSKAQVDITGMTASSDTQVDKIEIYRTSDGGASYYWLAEIANGTTTYTDTTTDANLSTTEVATDHDVPPVFKYLCPIVIRGRIFGANDSSLYWSKQNYPEQFDQDTRYENIQQKFGFRIVGLSYLYNNLVVLLERGFLVLLGESEGNFKWQHNNYDEGPLSAGAISNCANRIVYATAKGVYSTTTLQTDDTHSLRVLEPFEFNQEALRLNIEYKSEVVSCYYKNFYLMAYPLSRAIVADRTLVWDTVTRAIYYWTLDATAFCVWNGSGDDGRLLFGASDGRVHIFDQGETDAGTDITMTVQYPYFDFGDAISEKSYEKYVYYEGTQGTLYAYYSINPYTETFILVRTITLSDTALLPQDTTLKKKIILPEQARSEFMSSKFVVTTSQEFNLFGIVISPKRVESPR